MPFPDLTKFFSDPAFQSDRDFLNGVIDARLKQHAEEEEKRRKENEPRSIFDQWFGGTPK